MPEGWKNVQLGDILTPEQIDAVVQLACSTPDDFKFTQRAKDYLNKIATELEAKGVVPDYLAYVLTSILPTLRAEGSRRLSNN